MRHTAFLVLGTDYNNLCADIKKYVMMYGEGNLADYFNVINWDCKNGQRTVSLARKNLYTDKADFCSGLEEEYGTSMQDAVNIKTEEELKHFFSVLYDKTVTIHSKGDSDFLHLLVLLPLYNPALWNEVRLIMDCLERISQSYRVDIIGVSDDLAHLFLNEEECKYLPSKREEFKRNVKSVARELVSYKNDCKHRFIMIQNRNSKGVSLNLNHDSLISLIGEFSLVCIENYASIFPLSEEFEQSDISTIGLSVLRLDKFYFVQYLLRKAYLKVLEREKVSQREVDVNKVSQIAQNSLKNHVNIVSNFYDQEILPLVKEGKSDDDIIAEVTPKLDEKISSLAEKMQEFINRRDLSLPEKQATLAQILGTDDELLKGNQYNKKQLTIDDCDSEAVNLYLVENNKLIKRETGEKGKETVVEHGVLSLPSDKNGNVYLPIDELKKLRADIRESTNYVRQKGKELNELQEQLQKEEQSSIRLTENGFTYGGTTYKLLDIEEEPLQETYTPQENHLPSVDLRSSFTNIKNQGELGTCSVFSLVSIYEYILKKKNSEQRLSERFVYYNVLKDAGRMEDTGSSLYGVVESMTKYGVCAERFCEYDINLYDANPTEEAYADAVRHKIKCAKNVEISHKDITSALSEGYPISISLKIFDSFGNHSKGFIYRPTDEEIANNKFGNHAMVICGYSEEDKVYIVRNSWGKDFGDKGYCYIPFSYIEDSELANSACIITNINEGEEVKGLTKQTEQAIVSFNKMDIEIRYSIIRILVDEEKLLLNKNKIKYENLRINYETLIQTLCNNSKRTEIKDRARSRNRIEIENETNQYHSFINKERGEILRGFKLQYRSAIISLLLLLLGFIIAWGICFNEITNWISNTWNYYLLGGIFVVAVILCSYWSYRKHHYRILKDELEERAQQMALKLQRLKQNDALLQLHLYVAGMVIDRLSVLQKELHGKYALMKSYVGNLSIWQEEESRKIQQMEIPADEFFVSLLSNDVLEDYFEKEGEEVTDDLYLYKFLNGYDLNEAGIIEYKRSIKRRLANVLMRPLESFDLFSYLQGTSYPYLNESYSNKEVLLPMLDVKSDCFLQTSVKNIGKKMVAKHIFIHMESQNEQDKWNGEYPRYFRDCPSSGNVVSKYKLVLLQKANLTIEDIVDLEK